jgi:hypothetical protein
MEGLQCNGNWNWKGDRVCNGMGCEGFGMGWDWEFFFVCLNFVGKGKVGGDSGDRLG